MGFEDDLEKGKSKAKPTKSRKMSLKEAVDMGEYNPKFLATFPEWHTLSRHVQLQYIRQGIENRRKQLVLQYAEINNVLDFRLKPHLQEALKNIHQQLKRLDRDMEDLYLAYSK